MESQFAPRRALRVIDNGTPSRRTEGNALADDLIAHIRRYVVLTTVQVLAVALWVLHSHAIEAFDATPYLLVTSPMKRSGKTRLLEVLEGLVPRPWLTGRVTPAVLVRKVDAERPTLLLDESDAAFASGDEYGEALRGVLNTGHRRTGKASLCVGRGTQIKYRDFATFGAKAVAGIGGVPGTVQDRCIIVELARRAPRESVERFRQRDVAPIAEDLRRRAAAWTNAREAELREARPALPDALTDRQQDGWEPLLAVADALGPELGRRAREAAVALAGAEVAQDDAPLVRLLDDIRAVFAERGATRVPSTELARALASREESPWTSDRRGRDFDARKLAELLRPLHIRPRTIRDGTERFKGYDRRAFEDAFARYLSSQPSGGDNGDSAVDTASFDHSAAVTSIQCHRSEISEEASNINAVTDVTDERQTCPQGQTREDNECGGLAPSDSTLALREGPTWTT